jgi:hypothetical protein
MYAICFTQVSSGCKIEPNRELIIIDYIQIILPKMIDYIIDYGRVNRLLFPSLNVVGKSVPVWCAVRPIFQGPLKY